MAMPEKMQQLPADDPFVMWLRGEFAAANAIIDTLCHHLRVIGEPGEYDFAINCIQQRRCNWNSVLHLQQYFSVSEVMLALQQVAWRKQQRSFDHHHHHQQQHHLNRTKRSAFVKKDFHNNNNNNNHAFDSNSSAFDDKKGNFFLLFFFLFCCHICISTFSLIRKLDFVLVGGYLACGHIWKVHQLIFMYI